MSYDIDNWGDYRREMWAFPIHRAHERRRQATRWAQKRLKRLWYGADPFDTPEWRALCAHQARKMAYGYRVGRAPTATYERTVTDDHPTPFSSWMMDHMMVDYENDLVRSFDHMMWGITMGKPKHGITAVVDD